MEQLASTGKPLVTVLVEGRPRLLSSIPSLSSAVLQAGLPGPMGGQAIAEIIYGRVNPSGKLPYTYPKSQGDVIYPYHRKYDDVCTDPNDVYSYVPCEVRILSNTQMVVCMYICVCLYYKYMYISVCPEYDTIMYSYQSQ